MNTEPASSQLGWLGRGVRLARRLAREKTLEIEKNKKNPKKYNFFPKNTIKNKNLFLNRDRLPAVGWYQLGWNQQTIFTRYIGWMGKP